MEPIIHSIFEKQTSTWQYIVACPQSRQAVIIDPVLDFDPTKLEITSALADGLLGLAASRNYIIVRLLETHAHADHHFSVLYPTEAASREQPSSPYLYGAPNSSSAEDIF